MIDMVVRESETEKDVEEVAWIATLEAAGRKAGRKKT